MNLKLRTAGIAALLLLFVLATACGGDNGGDSYPQQVEDNFMSSCTESGGAPSQCRCAFNEFEDNFTLEEFMAIEQRLSDTDDVPEIQAIILRCLGD